MIKVGTLFSGIGSIEWALKRLNIEHEIIFACDNGEREIKYDIEYEKNIVFNLKTVEEKKSYVDNLYLKNTKAKNYVEQSYLTNYKVKDNNFFQDIVLFDGNDFKNEVDLIVGGSPCQSFSSVGFQAGLEDARGTLFYEYARIIKEVQPKVFIYENVRNLLVHDNGKTWNTIKSIFNSLNYSYKFEVLNASDYGIPQTRRRLFVVGFRNDLMIDIKKSFIFPPMTKTLNYNMKDFSINNCDYGFFNNEFGEIKIIRKPGLPDDKYILSEKIYNYVMSPGTKTFKTKVEINKNIARTLLKTMGNRHRAGVDNYLSFDDTEQLGSVRMLTEREAHRLMGFTDEYKIVVSRAQAYKQAGNSIVVDVMIAILKSIIKTKIFGSIKC